MLVRATHEMARVLGDAESAPASAWVRRALVHRAVLERVLAELRAPDDPAAEAERFVEWITGELGIVTLVPDAPRAELAVRLALVLEAPAPGGARGDAPRGLRHRRRLRHPRRSRARALGVGLRRDVVGASVAQ